MKTKTPILFALLISVLLMIMNCSSVVEYDYPKTFMQTYISYFPKDNIYFIKGIALDIYEYGRHIQVVEDMKGNFNDKSSIFVWGNGYPSEGVQLENHRLDDITLYQKNDTLIMFLEKKTTRRFDDHVENPGDYATLWEARSVLKWSNGYVTGHINSWYARDKIETILWKKLQEEMQAVLNSTKKRHL